MRWEEKRKMPRYVTKLALSKMGKTSKQLMTKYCAPGGKFENAVTGSGKIDLEDAEVQKWLEKRDAVIDPRDLTVQLYGKMTINEVSDNYGSVDELESYLKTNKMVVETEHKKMQMEASRQELVSREFVGKACFGIVETSLIKLLDMPRGMIGIIIAILDTKTLGAKEQAEQKLTEEISKILANAKKELIDRLGDEKPD